MHPGAVEVVAYQETLLLMAVFGVVVLAMIWAGFHRWLQHKDRMGRLATEQTAAQSRAQMERIETRLKAIEGLLSEGGVQPTAQIEASTGSSGDTITTPQQLPVQP